MTRDGSLDSSVKVVGAIGQEDERAFSILVGILAVDDIENINEAAGITSLHKIPVSLAVEVKLSGVYYLHTVDIHLTTALHFKCQRAGFTLIIEDSRTTVTIRLAVECGQCLVALLDENAGARAILAERYGNGSLRTNEQVNGVTVLEGPTMLCIVPVEAVAGRVEGLMVFSVEEFVGQVEEIFLVCARHLHLGLDSIELGVGSDDVCCGVLLAQYCRLEPTASFIAVLRSSNVVDIVSECTDSGIFLDSLCCQYVAFNVNILQLIVGLEDDVQHIIHLCVTGCHRDGDSAGVLLFSVSNLANFTSLCGDVCQRVALANHCFLLRQLQCGLIQFAKDILGSILVAVDLERSQYGNVLLGAIEDTLDNDVGQTNLLGSLQFVEEEFQSACAFTRCGSSDVIVLNRVYS